MAAPEASTVQASRGLLGGERIQRRDDTKSGQDHKDAGASKLLTPQLRSCILIAWA